MYITNTNLVTYIHLTLIYWMMLLFEKVDQVKPTYFRCIFYCQMILGSNKFFSQINFNYSYSKIILPANQFQSKINKTVKQIMCKISLGKIFSKLKSS